MRREVVGGVLGHVICTHLHHSDVYSGQVEQRSCVLQEVDLSIAVWRLHTAIVLPVWVELGGVRVSLI